VIGAVVSIGAAIIMRRKPVHFIGGALLGAFGFWLGFNHDERELRPIEVAGVAARRSVSWIVFLFRVFRPVLPQGSDLSRIA
jgi:hypothetical protein